MERRDFLKATLAAPMVGAMPYPWHDAAAQTSGGWRTFEIVTKVEIANPAGTRASGCRCRLQRRPTGTIRSATSGPATAR